MCWYKLRENDNSGLAFLTPLIADEVLSLLLCLKYHPSSQQPYMGIARQLFSIIYFWALLSPCKSRNDWSEDCVCGLLNRHSKRKG